jgi:hypothetical protein
MVTPHEDPVVRDQLLRLEPLFHRPEFGSTKKDFEQMMAPGFWEVGASGRRYSREFVLEALEERFTSQQDDVWRVEDFHCAEVAADLYLATYTLFQDSRVTRRVTIWRRTAEGWQAVYHQGTVVADA